MSDSKPTPEKILNAALYARGAIFTILPTNKGPVVEVTWRSLDNTMRTKLLLQTTVEGIAALSAMFRGENYARAYIPSEVMSGFEVHHGEDGAWLKSIPLPDAPKRPSKSVEDLEDEMRRWVSGDLDQHDKAVEDLKNKVAQNKMRADLNKVRAFSAFEEVGMGAPNVDSVVRMPGGLFDGLLGCIRWAASGERPDETAIRARLRGLGLQFGDEALVELLIQGVLGR